jgi:hypothetical protein
MDRMNRDALLQARLRSERPFLRVEKLPGEFAVYDVRDPDKFYVMNGFATQEQAEQYIARYCDDDHIAEVKRRNDEDSKAFTISKLLRGTTSSDDEDVADW